MEDVWRCSQHSLLLAPSPPTHSPTLIELFVSPPVIVAGAPNSLIQNSACIPSSLLHLQYSAYLTKCSWRAAQRRKGRFSGAISHNPSCDWVFHKGVLNNENYIWLRFTKAFPDITFTSHENAGVTGRAANAEIWIWLRFCWNVQIRHLLWVQLWPSVLFCPQFISAHHGGVTSGLLHLFLAPYSCGKLQMYTFKMIIAHLHLHHIK